MKILREAIYDQVFDEVRMNTSTPKVYYHGSSATPPFLIIGGPSGKEVERMKSIIGDTKSCR